MQKVSKVIIFVVFFFFIALLPSLNSVYAQTTVDSTLFSDDFNDGNFNGWVTDSGSWTVSNGNLESKVEGAINLLSEIHTGDPNWDNYKIELDENTISGVDSGVEFRRTDGNSYTINFRHGTGAFSTPEIKFFKTENNNGTLIKSINSQQLLNNTWYHIKIEVVNENIKLWVNDTEVLDYTDSGTNIKKGGIGLQSWTGVNGFVDVKFDNVNVTSLSTAPAKTPLIFIPGMAGSELKVKNDTHLSIDNGHGGTFVGDYKAGEKVWVNEDEAKKLGNDDYFDILKLKTDGLTSESELDLTGDIFDGAYDQTIKFFTDNGYTLSKDLFIFPYDWRKDMVLTTPLLDQKIQRVKQQTGAQQIDLVAHSMGGLVVRSYISDQTRATNVRKYISLGTPYLGTTHLLHGLIYGECLTRREFEAIKNLICLGLSKSEVKDVLQNSSGAYELAPSSTYYSFYNGSDNSHPLPFKDDRDIDQNGISGPLNYGQTKALLLNLKYNSGLYSFNESFHINDSQSFVTNNIDTTFIVGSGQPTEGQIIEGNRINFGGLKLIPYKDLLPVNGDDTTPIFSGALMDSSKNLNLSGSAKVYYAKLKHEGLPTDNLTLNFIKNILEDNNQVPNGISKTPYTLKGTQVSVHSPVNIDVYDSLGNHTGLDSNGDFEENIPGSSYDMLDDAKFIWLPEDGKYTVKFTATDQGSFTYKVRTFDSDQNTKTVLFNDVLITTTTKGEENLDTTAANPEPLKMDQNGDGITDSVVNPSVSIPGSEFDDHTPPEARISYNSQTQNIEVKGVDNVSNVLVTDAGDGKIVLRDDNGNITTLMTDVKDKKRRDKIQLQSIGYNQNPLSVPADNRFVVTQKLNRDNSIQQFDQKIIIKGDERLIATYDPKSKRTKIVTKEKGQEKKVEFKEGAISLFLITKIGGLETTY